jgi:hypothetical protein
MGNIQCAFCSNSTIITNYYCKYKKIICNTCINYIQSCSHCNEWYTKHLLRYNDKLYCRYCLEDLFNHKSYQTCVMCNKKCNSNFINHQDKIYCNECIEDVSVIYNRNNKKLK